MLPGATLVHYGPAKALRLLKNKGLLCQGKYKMTKDFSSSLLPSSTELGNLSHAERPLLAIHTVMSLWASAAQTLR